MSLFDMGNLFDELKKAKLIDKKQAKRLAHEARQEGKKADDRDEELAQRSQAFDSKRGEQREENREGASQQRAKERKKERWAELKQQVAAKALGERAQGGQRWHFKTESGLLPFLVVSGLTSRRLEGGELGIVRDPNASWPRYVLVPRELALGLKSLEPSLVRFLASP